MMTPISPPRQWQDGKADPAYTHEQPLAGVIRRGNGAQLHSRRRGVRRVAGGVHAPELHGRIVGDTDDDRDDDVFLLSPNEVPPLLLAIPRRTSIIGYFSTFSIDCARNGSVRMEGVLVSSSHIKLLWKRMITERMVTPAPRRAGI